MTRPYAEVIGDPISHSKSPLIHNFWLQKLGIDAEYHACHVREADLRDYFANRRHDPDWRGCNITIPHKEITAALVDQLLPEPEMIGAVNTVIRRDEKLVGANTDVAGVTGPLRQFADLTQTIAIIGAGGACRAAVAAVRACFPDSPIRFLARRPEQAVTIATAFAIKADIHPIEAAALEGVTLLINASPLGMVGKPALLLSLEEMTKGKNPKIVFDMVYAPLETTLLIAAQQEGFATIDGLSMLVGQAAEAFALLFGQPAPRNYDDELRALLVK
jgi:shikimate dehydrogenase